MKKPLHLKYRLVPFEKAIAFQIIEQDERWKRVQGTPFFSFKMEPLPGRPYTVRINSDECPDLCLGSDEITIHLQGWRTAADNEVVILRCYDVEPARLTKIINEALKLWSLEAGPREKEADTAAPADPSDPYTYTLG